MFKHVTFVNGIYSAFDEEGVKYHIRKSKSFLFLEETIEGVVYLNPVIYRDVEILDEVVRYLKGEILIPPKDSILTRLRFRQGWMDGTLDRTEFVTLGSVVHAFRKRTSDEKVKNHILTVTKFLSLSMTELYRHSITAKALKKQKPKKYVITQPKAKGYTATSIGLDKEDQPNLMPSDKQPSMLSTHL